MGEPEPTRTDAREVLSFFEEQLARSPDRKFLPGGVLCFTGTSNAPGSVVSISVNPLVSLDAGPARELRVALGGALPRAPEPGDSITVSLTRIERWSGYQVKTSRLSAPGREGMLLEVPAPGQIVVKGYQVYTVHHTPNDFAFFEEIPFKDVQELVGGGAVKYACVAVGPQANVSPRFIFHWETHLDRIVMYQGDGLARKTAVNLKSNRQGARVVVDTDTFQGFGFEGTMEEFAAFQHPEAAEKIRHAFEVGGFGKPGRYFRFVANRWWKVDPGPTPSP